MMGPLQEIIIVLLEITMNKSEIIERLKPIRCFLLDMDGTFYLGNLLLEGSLAFLDKVGQTGRQTMFLTNNSSKSARDYLQKLERMGVVAPYLNVLTSGQATAQYALKTFPGKRAYVLGTQALRTECCHRRCCVPSAFQSRPA